LYEVLILLLPLVFRLIKQYSRSSWDSQIFKKHIIYALPVSLIVVINSIIQYSDKLFLAHYTDTTELGYYSAAQSIGGMILLVSVSIGNIFFPLFSSLLATNDWAGVKKRIMQYQEFLVIFVFPIVCIIVIIATPLLTTVLGPRYEPSIESFMIIAFATYIVVVGMPYGNTIPGAGRFYLNVLILLIKLVVYVLSLSFFVSPHFLGLGATGLALNLLVVNMFTNLLFLYYTKRLSGLSFFSFKNTFRYIMIFSVSLTFYFYQNIFNDWCSYWWIVIIPVYLGLIYGMLFFLKLANTKHFKQLVDLLNIQIVFDYVKKELRERRSK